MFLGAYCGLKHWSIGRQYGFAGLKHGTNGDALAAEVTFGVFGCGIAVMTFGYPERY